MTDDYQALPKYEPPRPEAAHMSTAKEQAPLMKLMGKMLAPKMTKMMKMKGKISPQSVKVGHKKKTPQTIYY